MQTSKSESSAFCGVSLGSHLFSHRFFDELGAFAQQHEITFTAVLLADEPHAYSFAATKGISLRAAEALVRQVGDERYRFLRRVLLHQGAIGISRWRDFARSPAFKELRDHLARANQIEPEFAGDLRSTFVEHCRSIGLDHPIRSEDIALGVEYLIQEYAIMLFFYERLGFPLQIAPTKAPHVLIKLYRGAYAVSARVIAKTSGQSRIHITLSEADGIWTTSVEGLRGPL